MNSLSTNGANDAHYVMRLDKAEVVPFVADRLRKRDLSRIVRDLNADILDGTPRAREEAFKALARMGFVEDGS